MARFLSVLALFLSLTAMAAEPAPIKSAELVNQDGQTFQVDSLKGKFVLLSFLFTRCPMANMCPLNMQLSRRLLLEWKVAYSKYPLHILAVTLDPANDTPESLKKFGEGYGIDFKYMTLATGNPKTLDDFASQFNAVGLPAPGGMISHSMKTILLSPDLVPIAEYKDNTWAPEQVLLQIKSATPWWKRLVYKFRRSPK